MAPRDIIRALSRTSVTIAALMVAVSVIIGISIMIGSFRNTVIDWLNTILLADIYITPAGLNQEIDPAFIDQLADYPGVDAVEMARITTVSSPDYGPVLVNAFSAIDEADRRTFLWLDGTPEQANEALADGQVFVSEVFARQHNLPLNQPSQMVLTTYEGERPFTVTGIFYHYDPQGFVLMNLRAYQRLWNDPTVSSVGLYVTPETDADALVVSLRDRFAANYQLTITANRGIKQSAITVFDRTFTITAALRLLATIVAFIGVLSAIMSLQLERTRELGTLRANGMTLRQLWGLTLLETGLMGAAAGLISIPTGLVMAIILIYVINLRSFGWSLQLQLNFEIFLVAMLVAVFASLLAGIYPSLRLSKMEIAAALREE
jgi:putative ABC transport system permease protein